MKKKKKKPQTRRRYRDRRGRYSKLDRRKKLTVETFSVKTGKVIRVRRLKPKRIKVVKPPKRIKKAPEELIFCVPDLPEYVLEIWEESPGFEFFDRLNNLDKKKEYRMYLMLEMTNYTYRGQYIENMTYQIPEHHKTNIFTVYQFQKWCSEIVKVALNNAVDFWLKKVEEKEWLEEGERPPEVNVAYVFAYNPDKPKLPRSEYQKRWKKEEEGRRRKRKK